VWLIGAMVCLLAAPWVQLSVSAGNGWPHNALRHYWLMRISCHFRDCKALLVTSLAHIKWHYSKCPHFTFTFIAVVHIFPLCVSTKFCMSVVWLVVQQDTVDDDFDVTSAMANRMSLFYAHATPMLKVLSDTTSRFVSEVSASLSLFHAVSTPVDM